MAYSDFRYVEVAKYVRKINAVIREKRDGEAVMPSIEQLDDFRSRHRNTGVYTSVFRYCQPDLEASRTGPFYFDLDSEHLEVSHQEVKKLYRALSEDIPPDAIRTYFTGAKGFHIEVPASVLGVSVAPDLSKVHRLIAEHYHKELDLSTTDFGVYEPRRMWRMPDSIHQKTGLYKVELLEGELMGSLGNILSIAQQPRNFEEPEFAFSIQANEWFKSWTVRLEEIKENERKEAARRRLELFNKYGTSVLQGPSKKYVRSVWKSALEALREAEAGKNRNQTLSRQAYRLYITALDADMDVEAITNKLYDIGVDMGLESREVRATLKSALRGAEKKANEPRSTYA